MTRPTTLQISVNRLPDAVVWWVGGICILPLALRLLGVDMGMSGAPREAWQAGVLMHTLLEWTAVCIAIVAALLACIHYRLSGDLATPIIGITLLSAGVIDAAHILIADQLLINIHYSNQLVALTWVASRCVTVMMLGLGCGLVLIRDQDHSLTTPVRRTRFLVVTALFFASTVFGVIDVWMYQSRFLQVVFPKAIILRPIDGVVLLMCVFVGLVVLPRFDRRHPSLFSHALVICMIPHVAAQLHMAFGSSAIYDHDFVMAHALKIVAYAIPLIGIVCDYVQAYRREALAALSMKMLNEHLAREVDQRRNAEAEVRQTAEELGWEIVEHQKLEKQLRQNERLTRQLINSSMDMVIAVDDDLTIVEFNAAAQTGFGYSSEDILGKPLSVLYADGNEAKKIYEATASQGLFTGEIMLQRHNGEKFASLMSTAILSDTTHVCFGMVSIARDLGDRKQLEDVLRNQVAELEQFKQLVVGREKRMVELKQQINQLSEAMGKPAPYDQAFVTGKSEHSDEH